MNTASIIFSILITALISSVSYAQKISDGDSFQSQRLSGVIPSETPPLTDIISTPSEHLLTQPHVISVRKANKLFALDSSATALTTLDPLVVLQRQVAKLKTIQPLMNFEGLSGQDNENIFGTPTIPSDVNGDVGPQHYVQMVNNLLQVFDKQSGAALISPTRLSDLFAAAGKTGPCAKHDQGDPIVLYDHLADRWLLSQIGRAHV